MTRPYVFENHVMPSLEEMGDYIDRAQSYESNQNSQQALKNYVKALTSLSKAMRWIDKHELDEELDARKECPTFLFLLINILRNIANIYLTLSDYEASSQVRYLYQKISRIYESIGQYEDVLTGEQIKEYNSINLHNSYRKLVEVAAQCSQDFLDLNAPEINSDPLFEEIRVALSRASSGSFKDLNLETKSLSSTKSSSSSSSSSSCFIATAAYQTSIHPDLDTFRNFRDTHLLSHPLGRILVRVYYQISPQFAQIIRQHPTLQNWVRHQLSHLAIWLRQHQS